MTAPWRSPASALSVLALTALAAPLWAVPAPPADRADRFGIYHWSGDSSAWPGTPDRLAWGADLVASIGSRTIRVYMGPADPYDVNPRTNPSDDSYLERIAASPAYDALFRDPRFHTYLLTVFTSTGAHRTVSAVRRQIGRLGDQLLGEPAYAGKTFILLNWEGDNAIGSAPANAPIWDDFTSRTQARADGVQDARSHHPESPVQLYSGLEFNLVERDGVRCGEGAVRCVIDSVAPRVSVDYYSYSAWQSLNVKLAQPAASLTRKLRDDLGFALFKVRSRRPQVQEESFILGEWGFARSQYGECAAAQYVRELIAALEGPHAFHVSYAVYWQALDNGWRGGRHTPCVGDLRDPGDPEGQVDWLLYGAFRGRNAEITLSGATLQAMLGVHPVPPLPRCSAIDPQSVAGTSAASFLRPGGPLDITGQGFDPRGNTILILQAHDRQNSGAPNVLLQLSRHNGFEESPQRIDGTLPGRSGLHDGCALLWVASRDDVDSKAVLVRIKPE